MQLDDKQLEEAAKDYIILKAFERSEEMGNRNEMDSFIAGARHILSLQEDKVDKAIEFCDEKMQKNISGDYNSVI